MIRLDCKVDSQEGGEIEVSTENILPYLGIIEEKTIGIVSKYLRVREMRHPERSDVKLIGSTGSGSGSGLHINPPSFGSSDESGDDDDDDGDEQSSCLKPVHRSNINVSRLSRSHCAINKRRTFNVNAGRRTSMYTSRRT